MTVAADYTPSAQHERRKHSDSPNGSEIPRDQPAQHCASFSRQNTTTSTIWSGVSASTHLYIFFAFSLSPSHLTTLNSVSTCPRSISMMQMQLAMSSLRMASVIASGYACMCLRVDCNVQVCRQDRHGCCASERSVVNLGLVPNASHGRGSTGWIKTSILQRPK
jgi:hypothetical protein